MKTPTRYGFIGAGAIAQRRHLPECLANDDSVVAAIADPRKGRAAEQAGHFGGEAYTNWERMLNEAELDAVVVATPNAFHAPQTIAALKRGLHVLVEKPMATTRAEARQMIAAAKKAKRYLMVGMNQRLMPVHVKAREVLERGTLGRVLAFETSFKHGGPDGWSVDGASSWFFKKKLAVMGVNGDLGIHKADLMRYLLGEEFTHVGGQVTTRDKKLPDGRDIPVDDNAWLTLKTESGIIGSINISWTHYGSYEANGTTIFCENGVMRIGEDPQFGVIVQLKDGQQECYVTGAMASNTQQVASGVIDSFTDCIRSRRKPVIDGLEGYKALNVILTAVEASKEGKTKKIPR